MDNKNEIGGKNIFLLNYRLFLLAFLLVPLYSFNNKYIRLLGSFAIVILLVTLLFDSIRRMDNIKINKIFMWFLIFTSYSTLQLVRTPSFNALYSYLLQTLLLFFITMFSTITLDYKVLGKIFSIGKVVYLIMLIPAGIIALEGGRGAFGRFDNLFTPVLYKIMLPCTFFFIADSKNKLPKILFFAFIYLRMVERASSISLLIIYIVYVFLKKIKNSKKLYKLSFIAVFIGIISFIYIYVHLQYTEFGYNLNNFFRQHTGGNFFSGRNYIWGLVFEHIKLKPFIGYGFDNKILLLADITMSSHSTYVHLLMQGGILGLSLFFMFMYSIWESYFNYLDNDMVLTTAAYMIGTLTFINFEVTLVGNSTVTAIFYWFILGIGLAKSNSLKGG